MKERFLSLFLITSLVFIFSCEKDDEEQVFRTDINSLAGGGNADGGNADGGNAGGGNAGGGTADGGTADGGNADGGNADGGNADGGNADGGNADGGNLVVAQPVSSSEEDASQEKSDPTPSSCDRAEDDGDGSSPGNPHIINNLCQLQAVAGVDSHGNSKNTYGESDEERLKKHYKLGGDIDGSPTREWKKGFYPIGDITTRFNGTFRGEGFIIRELTIKKDDEERFQGGIGLFSYVSDKAQLIGIGIENINISVTKGEPGMAIGGLAGKVEKGSLIRSNFVTGNIHLKEERFSGSIGGLIGVIESRGEIEEDDASTIERSFAQVNISNHSGAIDVGGLVGRVKGRKVRVSSCYAIVNFIRSLEGFTFGSLIGSAEEDTEIKTSYAIGAIISHEKLPAETNSLIGKSERAGHFKL